MMQLPDATMGPLAAAVPSLFAAHMLVVRRCKTMASLEAARKSPLLLSITAFGIGVNTTEGTPAGDIGARLRAKLRTPTHMLLRLPVRYTLLEMVAKHSDTHHLTRMSHH